MTNQKDYLYIDTPDALRDFCQQLDGLDWLALDTEFLREKTYYPILCLIQVGTPDLLACIDPLALDDLSPLLDRLYDPTLTVVMHAGSQDLEILHHLRGEPPGPIFDTQLAAPLLGLGEQMGYAKLIEEILGVHLSKSHSRADWTRRPLPEAQLNYAVDDVRYLVQAYPRMRAQIEKLGRLHWLDSDFEKLTDPQRYRNPPELAWRRICAASRLRGSPLSVLQALAAWRETTAQQEDKPRNWLLKDDDMISIARMMPENQTDLMHVRGPQERMLQKHGAALLAIIKDAREKAPEALLDRDAPLRLDAGQEAMVDALMALLRLRCAEQSLNPAALATRKSLEKLASGDENSSLLSGWRYRLVGAEMQELMQGRLMLRAEQGRLTVVS